MAGGISSQGHEKITHDGRGGGNGLFCDELYHDV